jgi:hypothetical protein
MLQNLKNILHQVLPGRKMNRIPGMLSAQTRPTLKAIGITDFLSIDVPVREINRKVAPSYERPGLHPPLKKMSRPQGLQGEGPKGCPSTLM